MSPQIQAEILMQNYRDIMVRRLKCSALSPRTHQSYLREAKKLFEHYSTTSPKNITEDMVTDWLLIPESVSVMAFVGE
jgi:hypothetical protein